MSEVVRQLSERLVKQGHEVTVATKSNTDRLEKNINGVEIVEFDVSGNITDGIQGDSDRYTNYLLDSQFDIVTNFAAQQWATDLALPILSQIHGKKVFVPTGFSGLYMPKYQSYYVQMRSWLNDYDKVVYLSDTYRDANFARELGLTNGILIPNGASEEEFAIEKDTGFRKRFGIPENDLFILHISGYVGGKGHMDAINIFNEAKLTNASLVFVSPEFGDQFYQFNPFNKHQFKTWLKILFRRKQTSEYDQLQYLNYRLKQHRLRKILFFELPRKDVIQAYMNSDLFLFPSHVECSPIVLFESMAAKTPFLITDVGNANEIVGWSGAGIILPTIKSDDGFDQQQPDIIASSKILRMIVNDLELQKKMAISGYTSWIQNFTWEKITQKYEELYRSILSK